ncbi:MAG: hypothetical protein SO016_11350 [Lachnospiraceae bacterium]|nr:hypothetical protein [Robinsoniella sp.]MDY3767261.1 hypothetical protein [Lachnospiraceae bacterium]
MEDFRPRIKKRMSYLKYFICCVALIGAYDYFMIRNMGEKSVAQMVVIIFQIVILVGSGIASCVYLMKLRNCLWDEEKLRLLYAQENEEKVQLFVKKSGMPMILATSMVMILVGAVAAYFSIIVFYTLIIAAAGQLLAVAWIYFLMFKKSKKSKKN